MYTDTGGSIWNTARTAAIIADTLARQRELWGLTGDGQGQIEEQIPITTTGIGHNTLDSTVLYHTVLDHTQKLQKLSLLQYQQQKRILH